MQARGIDTSACIIDAQLQTGFSVILAKPDSDRAILTFPGSISALQRDHIDTEIFARSRHLHVGGYFLLEALQPDLPQLFRQAHDMGLTTSLDTNWDPSDNWDIPELLDHCDIFLPNQAEVERITRKEFSTGLDQLSAQIPIVAVKLGAEGGLARQDTQEVHSPIVPVDVVDTVGAGDSFDAGFLYGYLHEYSIEDSLRLACACGSLSTRAAGGTTAQPTLQEILSLGINLPSYDQ